MKENRSALFLITFFHTLLAAYGQPRWWSKKPYWVMFQAVLVQNTTWANVEKTCALLEEQIIPEKIARLTSAELERMIRPAASPRRRPARSKPSPHGIKTYGFYQAVVQGLPQEKLRKELLSLRGVGPETADVILVYSFYKPSFIVDAYTRRLLARLGYAFPNDRALRSFFEQGLPRDAQVYGHLHWLILDHCIQHCKSSLNAKDAALPMSAQPEPAPSSHGSRRIFQSLKTSAEKAG